MYTPLWCKSNFSFLEGASHPDELVEEAHRLGLRDLALTDRDGVYGIVRAHETARDLGVHLIVGAEVTIDDGSALVLLAQDRGGYASLCTLLTAGRLRSKKGECSVAWSEVCAHAPGLVAVWGGDRSLLARDERALGVSLAHDEHALGVEATIDRVANDLRDAFGDRLYALATRHRRAEEVAEEARLRARAARHRLPVAAGMEVLYHTPARRRLQDVLTCIRRGCTLFEAGRALKPNAEHALRTPHAFERLYDDDREGIARTQEIAARCTFSMSELRYRYPSERLPDGTSSSDRLAQLVHAGALKRYAGDIPRAVEEQLAKELALIDELDYCGYFLTMWEIVEFCRAHDILCQGRGSAANSAVCYCLHVTAVDPVSMGLLFERFLSRERAEPPDIDLDIEHERREEVIQHVYAKYGRSHAAMVANVIAYRARSAVRDVGKALGISATELDRIAKLSSSYDGVDSTALEQAGVDGSSGAARHLSELASELLGFPRHLSIHPGGFLLGHDPVSTLVPIENGSMEGRTVIQWDKSDVEALGLFKVDLLGLGALSHLHRSFDLLARHRGETLTMASVPGKDPETYAMISRADTIGVFQIESRAQMSMLPRLRPENYYDLVIEVSIVRPGPITGGMVHPYLRRRNKEEPIEYPHPCLEPVLEKTLGVPLFQEQVMRLAVVAADYTPGEADQLRRDMAAWRKTGSMEHHRERLIGRMQKKGIAPEFAERVYKQICGFGEYGFPESHAASFALVSYVGAWLKRHRPAEFACALLNAQPMGFYSPATIVEDAKRHGVEIRPVDVSKSEWECTLEPSPERDAVSPERSAVSSERSAGRAERDADTPPSERAFAVRIGLSYVKGLGAREGERIRAAMSDPRSTSLAEFVSRARLDEGALCALADGGALECFGIDRRTALWQVRGLVRRERAPLVDAGRSSRVEAEEAPRFEPLSEFDTIHWDHRRTHLSARGHPLEPLRAEIAALGLPDARTVAKLPHGERVDYAGLVICRQRPGTASGVVFMTLEDETGFVNVVLWQRVFEAHAVMARTLSFLGVSGTLQVQDGVVHVIADELWQPTTRLAPAEVTSHDFH
jgi:error-prone DNA polymerase